MLNEGLHPAECRTLERWLAEPEGERETSAFQEPARTVAGLVERLRLKIECAVLDHSAGRVLVFDIPSRPVGMPIEIDGAYWMRAGEDLRPMTQDKLRRIFVEAGPKMRNFCATVESLMPRSPCSVRLLL